MMMKVLDGCHIGAAVSKMMKITLIAVMLMMAVMGW